MGANVSAAVPAIALPVERYVADLTDMEFKCNLGSTRFMKVAKVLYSEGPCVVKVFVVNDPSLPLPSYMCSIEQIHHRLKHAPNCLPFSRVVQSSKAAFLIRQYVNYNLYDRLSTRPFLTDVEKRWIVFQLLKALEQCLEAGVSHGDIKAENVLITSSGCWTLLTDFANFKPSTIPYDNPADFTFFFDSSRRRSCYIAPERFVLSADASELDLMPQIEMEQSSKHLLKHKADVFSLGCVLLELFGDTVVPFDLSQLLAYRQGMYYPKKAMDNVPCPVLVKMIEAMINLDPSQRPNAKECLHQYGQAFPSIFKRYLWYFMKGFVELPLLSDDEKIDRIYIAMDELKSVLNVEGDKFSRQCVLIPLGLVTSVCRKLFSCDSKRRALELLVDFASMVDADIILDRILPFVLHFVNDCVPKCRAFGIQSVAHLMLKIKRVPASDARVFMDYIFPTVLLRTTDDSVHVKMALASCVGQLAVTARSFLEHADVTMESDPHVIASQDVDSQLEHVKELNALEDLIQDVTVTLLSDSDIYVRMVLMQDSLEPLCSFFGSRKAGDVLLSHIATFLNEKNDWRLRAVFFQQCPVLFACAGARSWHVLLPLYQQFQGLRDGEESVIMATLVSMCELFKRNMLDTDVAFELIYEVLPFLRHPNLLLQIGAVSFVCHTARKLRLCQLYCMLMPKLANYVVQPFFAVDQEECLLHALKEPVPRRVWDVLLSCPQLADMLNWFRDRQLFLSYANNGSEERGRVDGDHKVTPMPKEPTLKKLYEKLRQKGLRDEHEAVFTAFAGNLLRLRGVQDKNAAPGSDDRTQASCLQLNDIQERVHRADMSVVYQRPRPGNTTSAEWMQIFNGGAGDEKESRKDCTLAQEDKGTNSSEALGSSTNQATSSCADTSSLTTSSCSNVSGSSVAKSAEFVLREYDPRDEGEQQDSVVVDTTCAAESRALTLPCQVELKEFVEWQRKLWAQNASRLLYSDTKTTQRPPACWKPHGTLLAHLHEHVGCVSRLAVHSDGQHFASAGWDGSVKIWDAKSMIGRSISNRSVHSFKEFNDKVTFVDFADRYVVCSSYDGSVKILSMTSLTTKLSQKPTADHYSMMNDYLIDLKASYKGSHLLIVGLSHHGQLCCLDSRSPVPAWSFSNPYEKGLVTSLCVDQQMCSWALVGTETGYFLLWDLRFQLNVREFKHPANIPIVRLCSVDGAPSRILASFVKPGEVSEWDLESGMRHYALWSSNTPPLSYQECTNTPSSTSVTALYQFNGSASNPGVVLTGDDVGRIRYWNLTNAGGGCSVISSFTPVAKSSVYKYAVIDGTQVMSTADCFPEATSKSSSDLKVTTAHHDSITDVKACHVNDWLLITSSRDGVIKLWK